MTWKNSRIQAYKKLIRKLLINIFDLINYYAEEVVGLETPEDNQSYCFEDSNMKFDSNFKALLYPSHLALWVISQKMLTVVIQWSTTVIY